MATTVGALSVDLDLNSASFINNMKRATDSVDRSSRSMTSALSAGKTAVTGFFAAMAADKVLDVGKRALDYASSLGEQAQQLGVATKELQVYRYAASQVGIENEDMDKGLAKLTLRIGQAADGNKQAAGVFNELGISVTNAAGNTRSAGDVMGALADKLSRIPDPARRAQIEVELFGKTGQKLDTLLSGGKGAIDGLATAAEKLGIVLSDDQIQKADDTADKLASVKQVLEANIASVVTDNAGSILDMANALGTLTGKVLQFMNSNPQAALGIIGALAGSRAGPIGAGIGAVGGYILGDNVANSQADGNRDVAYRRSQLAKAQRELKARQTVAKGDTPDGGTSYLGGLITLRRSDATRSGATITSAQQEVARQEKLLRQAIDASRSAKPKSASGIPIVATGGGGGGGGGRSTGGGSSRRSAGGGGGGSGRTLTDEFAQLEGSLDPLKRANDEYERTNKLLDQAEASGLKAAHGFDALRDAARDKYFDAQGIEQMPVVLDDINKALEVTGPKIEDLFPAIDQLHSKLDEAFSTAREAGVEGLISGLENLRHGFGSLKDVALSVLDSIEGALLETFLYGPLREWGKGGSGGGGLGGLLSSGLGSIFGGGGSETPVFGGGTQGNPTGVLSFVGSLFGGGRAVGGDVDPSKFYLVGENGPELFAPGGRGSIIPNSALRGRGGNEDTPKAINFNFYGPVTNPQEIRRSAAQAGAHLLRASASGKRGV